MTRGESDTSGVPMHAGTLRIPESLWADIRVLAAKEGKSSNEWCREALELVVNRMKERDA